MSVLFNVMVACGGVLLIGGILAGMDKHNGKWPWFAAAFGALMLVVDIALLNLSKL